MSTANYFALTSQTRLKNFSTIMGNKKNNKNNNSQREVTLDGMMAYSKSEHGLHQADFHNYEGNVEVEPFRGLCHVQIMRGGDMYVDEVKKKKRVRSNPLFSSDNSTLSLGRDRIVRFLFLMPEAQLEEIPQRLVQQADELAAMLNNWIMRRKKGEEV